MTTIPGIAVLIADSYDLEEEDDEPIWEVRGSRAPAGEDS